MQRHKLHPFGLIVCLLGISALLTGIETLSARRHNAPAKNSKLIQVSGAAPADPTFGEYFR
jgi:hypothetical protein